MFNDRNFCQLKTYLAGMKAPPFGYKTMKYMYLAVGALSIILIMLYRFYYNNTRMIVLGTLSSTESEQSSST